MTNYQARAATAESFQLAEGPVWDAPRNRVLWVDIVHGEVLEGTLAGDLVLVTARHAFATMVGTVVSAADGRLLVAAERQLIVLATDGERTEGAALIPDGIRSRTNDGAVDPAGRFLIGTLALDERVGEERLLRVEDDGSITTIDDDLALSNGLAFSPDGSQLFSVDSDRHRIWVRDYDFATGATGERREHLVVGGGFPDGICMDAAGTLWVAVWGAGEVRHFAADGTLLDTVTVPAPNTSSVAFVGPDLDVLLISTARDGLSQEQLAEWPESGRLFTARVGAVGLPTTPWSGSWFPDS